MRVCTKLFSAVTATVLLLACGQDAPVGPLTDVDVDTGQPGGKVSDAPLRFVLQVGQSTRFEVGERQFARFVSFQSNAPEIADVTSEGEIRGVSAGVAQITASMGAFVSVANVEVLPAPEDTLPPVALSLELSPATGAALAPGAKRAFTATVTWSDGASREAPVTFSAAGGTISHMGVYTAGQVSGMFAVVAHCLCGLLDTATVEISAAAAQLMELHITPKSIALEPGASHQFGATAKWSTGATTVPPVSFSAVGGSVSSLGRYTAPTSAGTYRVIVAHTGGVLRDTATVTVGGGGGGGGDPETPPPTGGSGALFFSDNFDNGELTSANGFSWTKGVAVSVTTERSYSGTHSLRFRFKGTPEGTDSFSEQRFNMGRYLSSVGIEYMLYVPENFTHRADSPGNNKFIMLWRDRYSDVAGGTWRTGLEFTRGNGITSNARFMSSRWDFNHQTDGGPWPSGTPGRRPPLIGPDGPLVSGQWNRVRIYLKAASSQTAEDGIAQVWINDQLILNITKGRFFNAKESPTETVLRQGYLMGWSNSGYNETTDFFMDDVKFFTGNPGW